MVLDPAASSDPVYDGLDPDDVSVSTTDDDVAGITVVALPVLATTELGGTATFTIVLDTQPTAAVTLAVASSAPTEGTVSSSSVSFSDVNWDTPQQITVTGANDAIDDGIVEYTITIGRLRASIRSTVESTRRPRCDEFPTKTSRASPWRRPLDSRRPRGRHGYLHGGPGHAAFRLGIHRRPVEQPGGRHALHGPPDRMPDRRSRPRTRLVLVAAAASLLAVLIGIESSRRPRGTIATEESVVHETGANVILVLREGNEPIYIATESSNHNTGE